MKKYRELFVYAVFGVLTTIVNYIVYLPCLNLLNFSAAVSNVIAWIVAVAFAFFTNKPFVFHSNDWSKNVVLSELSKFIGCRIGSGVLETVFLLILVDILGFNGNIIKIVVSILVVIINYISSKILVFRKAE